MIKLMLLLIALMFSPCAYAMHMGNDMEGHEKPEEVNVGDGKIHSLAHEHNDAHIAVVVKCPASPSGVVIVQVQNFAELEAITKWRNGLLKKPDELVELLVEANPEQWALDPRALMSLVMMFTNCPAGPAI